MHFESIVIGFLLRYYRPAIKKINGLCNIGVPYRPWRIPKRIDEQGKSYTCTADDSAYATFELEDGITTTNYLQKLADFLPALLKDVQPDFVFYLSGVDILETDKFGKLKVTLDGCKERDRMVFSLVKGVNLPCVVAMGGGYSPQVKTIVEAHCNTFRLAKETFDLH